MTGNWEAFLHPHSGRALVIDTNLLLLLIVGEYNPDAISRFDRTKKFDSTDFETVASIIRFFAERKGFSTTPHVLAEVSNFLGRRNDLRSVLGALDIAEEQWREARVLAQGRFYHEFGLTDAALFELALEDHCVLTTDGGLSARISRFGGAVINYNYIRFPI